MSNDMTLKSLLNVSLQHVKKELRTSYLKRRLKNTTLDIEMSVERVADAFDTIATEEANITAWNETQKWILSELRDLGAI